MTPEKLVQGACLTYLQMLENQGKVYFIRNNSFAGFVERSNGSKGFIKNAKRGTPDLLVITAPHGRVLACEIKSPRGKQSEAQKEAEARIRALGGDYLLIRDVQELIDYFG